MHKIMAALGAGLLLLLTACPGNSTPGLTVTGKVVYPTGEAGAFLPVMVANKVTSTDAGGNFSAGGISAPYRLVVVQPTQKYAQIFEGVTRADPTVIAVGSGNYNGQANLTVNLSGAGYTWPQPSGYETLLQVTGPVNMNGGATGSLGTSYTTTLQWVGPASFRGSICALQSQKNSSNVAIGFNGYGQLDNLAFTDKQPSSANLVLNPIQSKTLSGLVTVPGGYTLTAKTLGFVCGSRLAYPFTFEQSSTPAFSYAAPVIGSALYLSASAKKGDASVYLQQLGVAADASGVSLALPSATELNQPADNALGVNNATPFSWSAFPGGIHQLSVYPKTSGPLTLTLFTTAASATLPDLSSLGYPLPKGIVYRWIVSGIAPVGSVNDWLGGASFDFNQNYSSGYSGERTFTTAP